jgi:hypothetical protein
MPNNLLWLNGIAASFSKWRWVRLRVIYVPQVPATTAGKLALGLGYDYQDLAPTSMQEIQMMQSSVSSPVWAGFEGACLMHDLNRSVSSVAGAVALDLDVTRCDKPWYKYITSAAFGALAPSERNIYGPAEVWIGTSGGVAGTAGDIFCSYEVDLIEPFPGARN